MENTGRAQYHPVPSKIASIHTDNLSVVPECTGQHTFGKVQTKPTVITVIPVSRT
jgi:hypothetical protein